MGCISPHTGVRTGWMLYKRKVRAYHPYVYNDPENAARKVGWYGDEVHRVEIRRIRELPRTRRKIKEMVERRSFHRWKA